MRTRPRDRPVIFMHPMSSPEIRFIAEAIRDGRCVLFTGPALSVTSDGRAGRSINQELAAMLRDMLARPEDVANDASLAHTAQVFLMEDPTRGRWNLVSQIQNEVKRYAGQTTDIHRQLARLPFRLCLTTTWDEFLKVAFEAEGKRPICEFLDYTNGEPKMPQLSGDPETPFLYRLYGSLQRSQSAVLTEDDLIDYLINVVKRGFPGNLVSILKDRETVFLFLGFGLYHWHLRVLLKILDEANRRDNPSFAFESGVVYSQGARSTVNAYALSQARVFYKYGHRILLRDESLEEFVTGLSAEFAAVKAGPRPESVVRHPGTGSFAPRIFLSYTRTDGDRVDKVEECLRKEGFNVWRDGTSLEGGDQFEEVIRREIADTDYFVFVESRNTEPPDVNRMAKVASWWRREVKMALDRSEEYPVGFRFVIPIRIEECVMPVELKAFERIDFFAPDGSSRLVSTISRDWQRRQRDGLNRGAVP